MGSWSISKRPKLVGIHPSLDCTWTWKKICNVKKKIHPAVGRWQGNPGYSVKEGYAWLMRDHCKVNWAKLIWAQTSIPRHAFITWVFIQHRLPIEKRLSKFSSQWDHTCGLCDNAEEDDWHLFFLCLYAQAVWPEVQEWWPLPALSLIHI